MSHDLRDVLRRRSGITEQDGEILRRHIGSTMSISSSLIDRINQVESWIKARPRPLVLCPLRLLCSCLLFVALMFSNLVAAVRFPFSAFYRIVAIRRTETPGEPIHVNEKRLLELFEQDLPVLVDFWAEWCGPCLLMNGVLSEFAKANASRVIVAKVDVTLHPRLAGKFKIEALPTILMFQRGQEVGRHVGPMGLGQLQRFVRDRK